MSPISIFTVIIHYRFLFEESSSVHRYYKAKVNSLREAIKQKKLEEKAVEADTEDNKGMK